MSRTVVTADLVSRTPPGTLVVPADAVVTPLARDVAADRGVEIVRGGSVPRPAAAPTTPPAGATDDPLVARVRALVTALLGTGGGGPAAPTAAPSPPPVKLVRGSDARLERFGHPGPPPGMDVATVDVVTGADGAPMAAGYMTITRGSFPWTFTYDEIQVVLEGELQLGGDGGNRVGRPGDVFYVPKGSRITFGTPTWARFVYVTFPADWEGGG